MAPLQNRFGPLMNADKRGFFLLQKMTFIRCRVKM